VTSGSNASTILNVISGRGGTLNWQGGTVNPIAIVPNTSGGFRRIDIPRCQGSKLLQTTEQA